MALKIRLRRVGAKKQPAYRIVIADARAPRDGRFVEIIGAYNPLTHPSTVTVDSERALYWMRNGAQVTDVVKRLFVKTGTWSLFTGEPMPEVAEVAAPAPIVAVQAEETAVEVVDEAPASVEEVAVVAEEAPVAETAAPIEDEPVVAEEVAPVIAEEAAPVVAVTPAE